jgi:hypothetical protein
MVEAWWATLELDSSATRSVEDGGVESAMSEKIAEDGQR